MGTRRAAPAALFSLAAIGLVAAVMTGCTLLSPASPTSTVTDASGRQVTLDWADYPADAWLDPAEVLAAPRAEQAAAEGDALIAELQSAIDAAVPGLAWERGPEGGLYPSAENGYGGRSLHQTLNSQEASTAPPEDWPTLVAAIEAALAEHGYGPVAWDYEREPWGHETVAERDADVREVHGSLDPGQMWQWMGNADSGSMWVSVILVDPERGVGGPADAEPVLALMAGGTVIAAADEQAYRDGIAPFAGLELPEESHPS
ncbi:hypothetical protein SAMN04487783_1616 [Agrococcus baldri]|uniref:Lipoprotein n=1 Tax=Agrococcus baldri TaxID=153730 RepID=A0AA94KZV1_9MICO|nr:hypothetical protein [Agrococcus baldri]SFS11697.1 hypothetical protein SAMN04487783_1616 [Agrococcus baldri]